MQHLDMWMGESHYCTLLHYYISLVIATRIPGHVQPVGRPCGTWMHYATRDVKDMGQQLMEPSCCNLLVNS